VQPKASPIANPKKLPTASSKFIDRFPQRG
jgi:hypothetical protein